MVIFFKYLAKAIFFIVVFDQIKFTYQFILMVLRIFSMRNLYVNNKPRNVYLKYVYITYVHNIPKYVYTTREQT